MTDTSPLDDKAWDESTPGPITDDHGRPALETMTDRALLIEIASGIRSTVDAVEQLENLPMIKAMRTGQNPLAAMMGR